MTNHSSFIWMNNFKDTEGTCIAARWPSLLDLIVMLMRCRVNRDADVHAPNAINVGNSKFSSAIVTDIKSQNSLNKEISAQNADQSQLTEHILINQHEPNCVHVRYWSNQSMVEAQTNDKTIC